MPLSARTFIRAFVALPLVAALFVGGCGSSDSSETSSTVTPSSSQFPTAEGQNLQQLAQSASASDLIVAPTQSRFDVGKNRYGFGVFTVDHGSVPDADLALYAARPGGNAQGPFPATVHSLATGAAFTSQTTSQDPDAAQDFYTAELDLPGKGQWDILALIGDGDGNFTYANVPMGADVGAYPDIPQAGDEAPAIHTPTADDVGGDLTKIDTRQPPDSMHDVDYADALGNEPIVLLFATPALCQSRVCGPVVDIAEEVKSERPDDAAFIHMEIWNDNDPNKGPRPQVEDFNLMTEPWLFVIDTDGKVSTVIEGAFSAQELNDAIDKADAASGIDPANS